MFQQMCITYVYALVSPGKYFEYKLHIPDLSM